MVTLIYSYDCNAIRIYNQGKPNEVWSYPTNDRGRTMSQQEMRAVCLSFIRRTDGSLPPYKFHYLSQGQGYEVTSG